MTKLSSPNRLKPVAPAAISPSIEHLLPETALPLAETKNNEPPRKKRKGPTIVLNKLLDFDRQHRYFGKSTKAQCHLIGTDEVGRGCLAGPVFAAAVIMPELSKTSQLAKDLRELNDSKVLTADQRERLAAILQQNCHWALGEATTSEINRINILQASLLAMQRAIDKLCVALDLSRLPVLVLIDGNQKLKESEHLQQTVVDGDRKSASIAAASIIAKVHRDRFMTQLAQEYPVFGWHQNKGYGSRLHREAIKTYGITEWHRRIFCEKHLIEQLTLDHLINKEEPEEALT